MRSSRPRTFGALFLSAWLGFLACLMGCSPAAFGSPRESASCPPTANAVTTAAAAHKSRVPSNACCDHHGNSPSPANHTPQKQSASCCPLDATFQKQSQTSHLAIHLVAVGPVTHLAFTQPPAFAAVDVIPVAIHSGRDVLLQSRILRI